MSHALAPHVPPVVHIVVQQFVRHWPLAHWSLAVQPAPASESGVHMPPLQ
jgi:hypothetical protein